MKRILLITFVLFSSISLFAQNFATGYVYEDVNKNGKKDKKEKGIANVAVSNGKEVVLSDSKGFYKLPIGNDDIIFVIKPTGYKVLLDEFNLPKFYYIHKPYGSPKTDYQGVLPTGNLPEFINFGLIKYKEPENFTSFIFGDSQVYNEKEIDFFIKGIIKEAQNRKDVSFGITLGDLVGNNLDLHPLYKTAIREMQCPWYNVIGNHDINFDATVDSLSDETFERNFGPTNYSFNYGQSHFIVLDDVLYPNPNTGKGYLGGLRDDQFSFLINDLKFVEKDKLIIIALHIPFLDKDDKSAFRQEDQMKIFSILKDYPNVLFLSAHTHIQHNNYIETLGELHRTKPLHEYNVGTTCGDWYSGILNNEKIPISTMRDGTPKGYALLNIKGNSYTIDYKVADKPDDYQMSIYNPKVVSYNGKWVTSGIYVNFFMGSKDSVVEYRVDNGNWLKMDKVEDYDPAYYKYMQDWDFYTDIKLNRRPSNAQICSHLWRSKIPTNLPIGTHKIEVKAIDMFGRTHMGYSVYDIK